MEKFTGKTDLNIRYIDGKNGKESLCGYDDISFEIKSWRKSWNYTENRVSGKSSHESIHFLKFTAGEDSCGHGACIF